MFCDPSHIGGKREFVPQLAQTALDLNYDGLMIEVHPDPDNAHAGPHCWPDTLPKDDQPRNSDKALGPLPARFPFFVSVLSAQASPEPDPAR